MPMRYGLLDGLARPLSRIVLGTSGMRSYEAAAPLLDAFAGHGGSGLDSAFAYADGQCEQVLGRWLRRSGARMVLIGKGAHPPQCVPGAVGPQLAHSLHRLGTGHVDLYLLHRDAPEVPVDEWVDALRAEVHAGRAHAVGVSNWSAARVDAANAYAARTGGPALVAVSNHFSLGRMARPLYPGVVAVSAADAAWLRRTQLALLPWSSQARGFFSDTDPAALDPRMSRCWDTAGNRARRTRAAVLAARFGVRPINVALAYVLAQPFPTFPLVGPRTVAELEVALCALTLDLPPRLLHWLSRG